MTRQACRVEDDSQDDSIDIADQQRDETIAERDRSSDAAIDRQPTYRSGLDVEQHNRTAGEQRNRKGRVFARAGGRTESSRSVEYDPGPDADRIGNQYGIEVAGQSRARRIQRLETSYGSEQVRRWVDEGMTVDIMGKPRDMAAFRNRRAARPDAVPTDIERRTQASRQRNRDADAEDTPAGETGVPDVVRSVVSAPGATMDETVQREMESKIGGDFSDVRLHTGPEAAAAADAINARAFTVGNHVAFARGEYQPSSESGKRLLAHELTHVRQATAGAVSLLPDETGEHPGRAEDDSLHVQPKLEVSDPDDPAEREAEAVAERVVNMDAPEPDGAAGHTEAGTGVERVTPEQAVSAASRNALQLVDVRSPDVYRRGHLPGAVNAPAGEIYRESTNLEKADELALYCQSGNRSAAVARRLSTSSAVSRVRNVDGGLRAWDGSVESDGTERGCGCGSGAVQRSATPARSFRAGGEQVQAKLAVGSADDRAEREAERVARAVVDAAPGEPVAVDATTAASGRDATAQRSCGCGTNCRCAARRTESIRRQAASGSAVDERTETTVQSGIAGGGKPLPSDLQASFESKFGADFSDVRVHDGAEANEAARSINAEAYTMGSDIAFADGKYEPGSKSGKELLAHELTHVVQQNGVSRALQRSRADRDEAAVSLCHRPFSHVQYDEPMADCDTLDQLWDMTAGNVFDDNDEQCRTIINEQLSEFARHCFLWVHDSSEVAAVPETDAHKQNTFTYDNTQTGVPDGGALGDDVECPTTYTNVDAGDIESLSDTYHRLDTCDPETIDLVNQNCCSCAWHVLEEIGAGPSLSDFPEANEGLGLPSDEDTWKRYLGEAVEGGRSIQELAEEMGESVSDVREMLPF